MAERPRPISREPHAPFVLGRPGLVLVPSAGGRNVSMRSESRAIIAACQVRPQPATQANFSTDILATEGRYKAVCTPPRTASPLIKQLKSIFNTYLHLQTTLRSCDLNLNQHAWLWILFLQLRHLWLRRRFLQLRSEFQRWGQHRQQYE